MTRTHASERGSAGTAAAAIGLVTALVGLAAALLGLFPALPDWTPGGGESGGDGPDIRRSIDVMQAPASVFANPTSGAEGTTVTVSGEGFGPGDRITIRLHTVQLGEATANEAGAFSNVTVTVPGDFSVFAPKQLSLVAEGRNPVKSADTPFTVTG